MGGQVSKAEFDALKQRFDDVRDAAERDKAGLMDLLAKAVEKGDNEAVDKYNAQIEELRKANEKQINKLDKEHRRLLEESNRKIDENNEKFSQKMHKMQGSQLISTLKTECRVRDQQWMHMRKQATTVAVCQQKVAMSQIKHDSIKSKLQRVVGAEMEDKSILRVVLYGQSGHGKSTLANRLVGDVSPQGNEGYFETGGLSTTSCTEGINKQVIKGEPYCPTTASGVSITDVPGLEDTKGRDMEYSVDFVEHLRGIGFLNAVFLVKMLMPSKWSPTFKDMLRQLSRRLGKRVWKNVIIVMTNATREMTSDDRIDVLETLYTAAGISFANDLDSKHIPIVVVDLMDATLYPKRLSYLCTKLLPKMGRFECKDLRSPLDDLMEDVTTKTGVFEAEKAQLETMLYQDTARFKTICDCIEQIESKDNSFSLTAELGDLATMATQNRLKNTTLEDALLPANDDDEKRYTSVLSVPERVDTTEQKEWQCTECGCNNAMTEDSCVSCSTKNPVNAA